MDLEQQILMLTNRLDAAHSSIAQLSGEVAILREVALIQVLNGYGDNTVSTEGVEAIAASTLAERIDKAIRKAVRPGGCIYEALRRR